jgi:hypothetical protein
MVCVLISTLFADATDAPSGVGQIGFLMFVSGAIGTAGQYLVGKFLEVWRDRKGREAADRESIVAHQQALIARLDAEKTALHSEVAEKDREIELHAEEKYRCKIARAVLLQHARYLEFLLSREKIPFERYVDDEASDAEGGPKQGGPHHAE